MSAELIQPPHSESAERAVLSAIIAGVPFDDIGLSPDDFYLHRNRDVFEAALSLAANRQPVDIVTISEAMDAADTLSSIGGMHGLGEYTEPVRNIAAYANIVRENAQARMLVSLGMQAISADVNNWRELADQVVQTLLSNQHTTQRWDCNLQDALRDGINEIERALESGGLVGVNTGFERLNKTLGGFHSSDLLVLGARPSMGKTAMMLNFAQAAGVPIGIVSAEMPRSQLALRLISARSGVNGTSLRNADLDDGDYAKITAATSALKATQMEILDKPAPLLPEVINFARRAKRDKQIKALYVDYIQRIRATDRTQPKHEQVGEVAMGLKELARELEMPVIALAQVNREVEKRINKRPQMGDLKDSGAIEQEADTVMLLYRDDVYDADSPDRGIAELLIDKNRHGPCGTIRLAWDAQRMRFSDLAPSRYYGTDE